MTMSDPYIRNISKSVTILGIDPGYGRCGFAVIEGWGAQWRALTHGVITTEAGVDFPQRLGEISADLEHIIATYKPDVLVLEELFFSKSTTTALKVAEVRGVITYLAQKHHLLFAEAKPNEVKIALTGYGNADKHQMQEMVRRVFQLEQIPKPDDAADALAIAWTVSTRLTRQGDILQIQ